MAVTREAIAGERVLVTGATSQVGWPVVCALAGSNTVFAAARFRNDADRARVREAGAEPVVCDLGRGDFADVPRDVAVVLHFAVAKSGDFERDLRMNAEGPGLLMEHCRPERGFLHVSSAAVYEYAGHGPVAENAALGDNHRAMFPTYSLAKIAAESVVRTAARSLSIPTTIARLSVPYGTGGGWPWFHLLMMQAGSPIDVHPDAPSVYSPLHEEDYVRQIPALVAAADVPATTVNWGGRQAVSIEQWSRHLGELTGLAPEFVADPAHIGSLELDLTALHRIAEPSRLDWRDGMRRMIESRQPELLAGR